MNSYSFTLSRHREEGNRIYFTSYLIQPYKSVTISFTKEKIDPQRGKYSEISQQAAEPEFKSISVSF